MSVKTGKRSQMLPLVVALDLEYNQPSKKIIQLGAVLGNITTGEIVLRFSAFANPNEALAPAIIKLTGIQQADVDAAGTLGEAYQALIEGLKPFESQRHLNALTWGGGDSEDLRQQLGLDKENVAAWKFGRRWLDVKTVFIAWRASRGKPGEGGLARSLTKLRLKFRGRQHNALHDAENTFLAYVALLNEFKVAE